MRPVPLAAARTPHHDDVQRLVAHLADLRVLVVHQVDQVRRRLCALSRRFAVKILLPLLLITNHDYNYTEHSDYHGADDNHAGVTVVADDYGDEDDDDDDNDHGDGDDDGWRRWWWWRRW